MLIRQRSALPPSVRRWVVRFSPSPPIAIACHTLKGNPCYLPRELRSIGNPRLDTIFPPLTGWTLRQISVLPRHSIWLLHARLPPTPPPHPPRNAKGTILGVLTRGPVPAKPLALRHPSTERSPQYPRGFDLFFVYSLPVPSPSGQMGLPSRSLSYSSFQRLISSRFVLCFIPPGFIPRTLPCVGGPPPFPMTQVARKRGIPSVL